jgi:hypothetical protein
MTTQAEAEAGATWRLVLATIVLALALLGGVAALVFEPEPTTVTCVVTTSGQSLCPEPVEV